MITKQDCLLLLGEIQNNGVECKDKIRELLKEGQPTLNVLSFINDNRQLDVTLFYEKLRKSYNNKINKLYINIVDNNFNDPKEIITTLASLTLQILLYNKNVVDSTLFLKHCRFEEITSCLYIYSKTFDIIPSQKLLKLIKADLIVLEMSNGRRTNV